MRLAARLGAPPIVTGAMTLAAGSIGGFIGKKHPENEDRTRIPTPTLFNKDALLGGLIGLVAARLLTLGTVTACLALPVACDGYRCY